MSVKNRQFISIYFRDGFSHSRNKRDLTVSFDSGDPLFHACQHLGSSRIKEVIGVSSFEELAEKADADGRTLGNYIKYRLRMSLFDEKKNSSS